MLVEAPDGADQPKCELRCAHFHREDDDRQARGERNMLADVEGQARFSHARPSRDDHKIAGLHAGGHPVEIRISGGHPGDVGRIIPVVEDFNSVDDPSEQCADRYDLLRAAGTLFGDMQDLRLGLVKDLLRAASERVVGRVRRWGRGPGRSRAIRR